MNEFARKAMELADAYAKSTYYEQRFGGQGYGEARDAARAALVAHLEGDSPQLEISWIAKEALLPATPTEEQSQ